MNNRMIIVLGIYLVNYSLYSMELSKKNTTEIMNKYGWVYRLYGLDPIFATLPNTIKNKIKNQAFPSGTWYEDRVLEQKDRKEVNRLEKKLIKHCFLEASLKGMTIIDRGRRYIVEPVESKENCSIEKVLASEKFDRLMLLVKDKNQDENRIRWYVYRNYTYKTLEDLLCFLFPQRYGNAKK